MTPAQKALSFRDQYNNRHIDEDGYYGAQCWDVVARYAREKYGCPSFPTVTGGAAGLFTNTAAIIKQYFDRVANNPNDANQIPPDGAIIVWGTAWSPIYGHTAIKLAGGRGQNMTVFEQDGNNPGGNAYQKVRNYSGVIGWLVPKNQGVSTMIVQDAENWYGRLNKLHMMVLGDPLPRDGFKGLVGLDTLTVIERFCDHPQADAALNWQNVGRTAVGDDWQGQIGRLSAEKENALQIAQARRNNYLRVIEAFGIADNPTEEIPTDQVIKKIEALANEKSALEQSLTSSNQNIIALQQQIRDLGDGPDAEIVAALQAKIDAANKQILEDQKAIEKAHQEVALLTAEKTQADIAGSALTRWIKDQINALINRFAGVK